MLIAAFLVAFCLNVSAQKSQKKKNEFKYLAIAQKGMNHLFAETRSKKLRATFFTKAGQFVGTIFSDKGDVLIISEQKNRYQQALYVPKNEIIAISIDHNAQ